MDVLKALFLVVAASYMQSALMQCFGHVPSSLAWFKRRPFAAVASKALMYPQLVHTMLTGTNIEDTP
jgi:hypothetical protein